MVIRNKCVRELKLLDSYYTAAMQGMLASDVQDRRPVYIAEQALLFAAEALRRRNAYLDKMIDDTEAGIAARKKEKLEAAAAKAAAAAAAAALEEGGHGGEG